MSKKLIAVASAAALALSALVAIPAGAAAGAFAVSVTGNDGGTGISSTTAYGVELATGDVLRTSDTLVTLTVTTTTNTAGVTVTAAGGAKVITKDDFDALSASGKNTKAGASSAATAAVGGSAVFYAYTTSTTASTLTVVQTGTQNSKVIYIEGTNPAPYNLTLKSAPSFVGVGQDVEIEYTVTDAFGNAMEDANADFVVAATKVGPVTLSTPEEWDSVGKVYYETVTGTSPGGQASVALNLTATKVSSLGTPKTSVFVTFGGGDLSVQVAALTAQVAALTADYNALAAKWNKRVASKTAPKKKTALK
jgi:hypothetical protein